MKLYQSVGPNPRVVLMYVADKGFALPRVFIDIMKGENRQPDYVAKNPFGGTPLLELDDGSAISESVAICEYLEEQHPSPPLIGTTPEERAVTRMLVRRIDHEVVVPMSSGFRSAEGLAMFQDRLLCRPDAADANKAYARDGLAKFDAMLADRHWLAGGRFTLADILLFCFVEFGGQVGQPLPTEFANIAAWHGRVAARPSAAASADAKIGL